MTWNTPDDIQSPWSRIYNTYIFQARRYDEESQLYYFRTRHYDSNTGRFIQRDKPGDWYDEGNLGNGYNFVQTNPMTFIDPFGVCQERPIKCPRPRDWWLKAGLQPPLPAARIREGQELLWILEQEALDAEKEGLIEKRQKEWLKRGAELVRSVSMPDIPEPPLGE